MTPALVTSSDIRCSAFYTMACPSCTFQVSTPGPRRIDEGAPVPMLVMRRLTAYIDDHREAAHA